MESSLERKQREWISTSDRDEIHVRVLEHDFKTDAFCIVNDEDISVRLKKYNDDGYLVFEAPKDISLFLKKELLVYKLEPMYMELKSEILGIRDNLIACKPLLFKEVDKPRRFPRYENSRDIAYANNIVFSRSLEDMKKALGVVMAVLIEEANSDLKHKYSEEVKVASLLGPLPGYEEEILKMDKKPIIILDTLKMESSKELDCSDLKQHLEEDFQLEKRKAFYHKEKIHSFIYYPITIEMEEGSLVIAYCYADSREGNEINIQKLIPEFDTIKETILKKVHDYQVERIKKKQAILNFCEGGALFEFTQLSVISSLNSKPIFTTDIIFKNQPKIRLTMRACHVFEEENTVLVGAEVVGTSTDEKYLDRYRKFVKAFKK